MALQSKALLLGLGLAATAAVALSGGSAKAAETPKSSGGKKATKSSAGKKTPSGVDPAHLADQTTDALLKQDIARIRELASDWSKAGDKITSDGVSSTLEEAVKGTKLEEWNGDGEKGSPLLRAWGDRVLLLDGRPEKLLLWSDAWKNQLPILAAALKTKAHALDVDPKKGSTDDPIPDADMLQRIIATVTAGDPIALRKLADELEKNGFAEAAADLRAMADLIQTGQAKPPDVGRPSPPPKPDPHEPQHPADEPLPPPKPKTPAPAKPPSGGGGRVVVVKKGEGPFQIAQRLLGKSNGGRFHELVSENVPPKKKAKDGGFTTLNPGERLKVPASWPASPDAIPGSPTATAPPSSGTPSIAPVAVPSSDRFVVVQKGEGPFAITKRVLGAANANRWPELVSENVPPKKKETKAGNNKGGFTTLNPGERLKVPASWPSSPEIVVGADGSPVMSARQNHAAAIALNAHLGKLDPDLLAEWQRREGIPSTGQYDPASAYVLTFRFGFVPPVPHFFPGNQSRNKFAAQMTAAARKDPARSDEYLARARKALGKAA